MGSHQKIMMLVTAEQKIADKNRHRIGNNFVQHEAGREAAKHGDG